MKILMTVGALGVIPLWWFTTDEVSPGTGDNMIVVALAREGTGLFSDLKKQGHNPLKHTRLICPSVDGEEAGLRGSMAYVKRHKKEITGTKTYDRCREAEAETQTHETFFAIFPLPDPLPESFPWPGPIPCRL